MYVRNLKKDKSSIYYQSLSRWIGVDSKQINLIWIYGAGAGAAGLILLFLVLNMILRSQVRKRTQELDAKNQALIREIERRKNVEAALQKNEREYRSVFENTGTATFIVEEDMTISKVNEKAAKMIGYPKFEIEGKMKTSDFISRKDLKRLTEYHYDRRTENGPHPSEYEFDLIDRNGIPIKAFIQISVIPKTQKSIASLIDITSRVKLEEKLQQAQKMKAIGTLAGGVAHDLNNILSGIVSYPDLILMDLPENSPLIEPILTIQQSGKKAAAIVQDLLTLARRGVSVSEVVNLNDIIDEYLMSPQLEKLKSYHPEVEIKSNLDSALLNIMGSPVHLSKTVMNLVSNAAEAMPDGGNVEIKAENKYIDTPISGYEDVAEGDYAVLTVSDHGIGIAPDEINRIFEPFYTKKVMGRSGTGLGASILKGSW